MKQSSTMLWLIVLVVLACIVIGGVYGILPGSLQPMFNGLANTFAPKHASKPYLEKFEGTWQVVVSDGEGNAGTDCVGGSAATKVHDGAFKVAVVTQGHTGRALTATIEADGTFAGSIKEGINEGGSVTGSVAGSAGQGSWADDYGCSGTVTLTKQDPVIDPTVGKVANYTGAVSLERGDAQTTVFPGMPLYAGDVVSAQGGEATLSFGVYPPTVVTVKDGQSYTVPANSK